MKEQQIFSSLGNPSFVAQGNFEFSLSNLRTGKEVDALRVLATLRTLSTINPTFGTNRAAKKSQGEDGFVSI